MDSEIKVFWNYLRNIRKRRGLTLENVASKLKVTKQNLSYLELGKSSYFPKVSLIRKLSDIYMVPMEILTADLISLYIPKKSSQEFKKASFDNSWGLYHEENEEQERRKRGKTC